MSSTDEPAAQPGDLTKRLMGNVKPFHSSAYAAEANGERMGSTNTQSFAKRLDIERNRQVVRGYRESTIGRAYGVAKAAPLRPGQGTPRGGIVPSQPRPSLPPTRSFREPPARGYNPYG